MADDVEEIVTELSKMNEMLQRSQSVIDRDRGDGAIVDVADLIRDVAEEYEERYPDATIELAVDGEHPVRGGTDFREAIAELVENAIVHADGPPHVTVEANDRGSTIAVVIADRGTGIPDSEREVIMREADIDQLTHSQGLGLWYVRWVMDTYDGDIEIRSNEMEGTTVTLELPKAAR